MIGHADPRRRQADNGGAADAARRAGALVETEATRALTATARLLNARPAVVAQRALSDTLGRARRGSDAMLPGGTRVAPIQLMNGGQPPDPDEWEAPQGGGGQQNAGQGHQGGAPGIGGIVFGPFQQPDNEQAAQDQWWHFPNPDEQPPAVEGNGAPNDWANFFDQAVANHGADGAAPVVGGGDHDWANFDQAFGNHDAAVAVPPQNPHAGHGVEVAIGGHHALVGLMFTTDLFNCVALVAYNPQTLMACLYHWNTGNGAFTMVEDGENEDGDPHYRPAPNPAGFNAARAVIDAGAPGATVYRAVLGRSWAHAELAPRRSEFEAALTEAFPDIVISPAPADSARWAPPDLIGY